MRKIKNKMTNAFSVDGNATQNHFTAPIAVKKGEPYRGKPSTNPYILQKKTIWMQRVADAVRAGARLYVEGTIPLQKAAFLTQKFASRYELNLTKMADSRARKAKKDVARWIAYYDGKMVNWILFYFPGGVQCKEEKWKSVADFRITHRGYELVKMTKPGEPKPVLTWRYHRDEIQQIRDKILHAIKGRQDGVLEYTIKSVYRSPGFAGIRDQVIELTKFTKIEWKRHRGKDEVLPKMPARIGYVRRLADDAIAWSELIKSKKEIEENDDLNFEKKRERRPRTNSILRPSVAGKGFEGGS